MRIIFVLLLSILSFSISNAQKLKKPSEGKSLVYIMRSVDLMGSGLNFRVYHKDKFLGALPSRAYFTYECEPGKNLFWVASENRDFVDAELEEGKTYVIDLKSKMGMFIAAVEMEPYSPNIKKHLRRVNRVLKNHINAVVADEHRSEEKKENIEKAMEAYNRIKDNTYSKIEKLTADMNFENE